MKAVMVTCEVRLSLSWALGTRRKTIPRSYPASISNTVLGSGYQEEDDTQVLPGVQGCTAQGSQKGCPTLCLALSKGSHCREGRGGHGDTTRKVAAYTGKENMKTKQGWDMLTTKGSTGGPSAGLGMKGYQRMLSGVKV